MPVNTSTFNSSTFLPSASNLEAEGTTTSTIGTPTTVPPGYAEGNTITPNEGVPNTPAIEQQKFLGATVHSFTTNVGYNEQQTTVTIYLVEDKRTGDDFLLKEENHNNYQGRMVGQPVSFTMGLFRFDGIILAWQQQDNFQGHPLFEVTLVTPTMILEGTQVILSNYVGPTNNSLFNGGFQEATFQLSNLLNVYGYLEDGGNNFGNSGANDTGLLWEGETGLRNALETLTNTNQASYTSDRENFGSYLFYRDHAYRLDLSSLPVAPSFYRVGGPVNMSLMDIITTVCRAAGVYFLINLTIVSGNGPHVISFKVVDLVSSANLNTIGQYIASQQVSSSTVGQELRTSDVTQSMLLGGDIVTLYPQQNWNINDPSVVPFWGFDVDGNPITGQKPNGTFFADDDYTMNLNASEIADIMGSIGMPPSYPCSILELRCALIDYDSWAAFLFIYKNDFATALGIYGAAGVDLGEFGLYSPKFVQDFVNDSIDIAVQLGGMNNNTQWTTISHRVYEYVKNQAGTYYGKQFLVKIPFNLQIKVVPDTTQVILSDEPADAGFLPEASLPLGLNFVNENFFLSSDGRMSPFFRFQFNSSFNSISGIKVISANSNNLSGNAIIQADTDLSKSYIYIQYGPPENAPVLQDGILGGGNVIFVRGPVGLPVPAIVCIISDAVFAQATDPLGGADDIATILGVSYDDLLQAAQFRNESFPMKIHPPAFYPNGVAVALKSNQYTYGPWGRFISNGMVNFEQDPSLTPWEYGGYGSMTQGALARLATMQVINQVKERGSVNHPGEPTASLGDVLINGGPTIGNIEVTVDTTQGITTSYTMETYVPRVGRFSDENASRIKRYGQLAQQMRRSMRQLLLKKQERQQIINLNNQGFMQGTSYAVQQRTPHAVMGGHLIWDSGTNGFFPMAYTQTLRESVGNINAHNNGNFQQSACTSLEALFRPVSTNIESSSGAAPLLSHYQPIRQSMIAATPITNSGIQPLRPNNDFFWFSHGETYRNLNTRRIPGDVSNARIIAHRGPMLLTGWGYSIDGKPIPNAAGSGTDFLQNYSSSFKDNYLRNSQDWPTGAIGLFWNPLTGTWTIPTMMMGWVSGVALEPYGNSNLAIMLGDGTSTGDTIEVSSFYASPVETGVRVQAMYYQLDNKYYVFSADCRAN